MLLRHRSGGRDADELTVEFCTDNVQTRDEFDRLEIRLENPRFRRADGQEVPAQTLLNDYEIVDASDGESMHVRTALPHADPVFYRPPGVRGVSGALVPAGCLVWLPWTVFGYVAYGAFFPLSIFAIGEAVWTRDPSHLLNAVFPAAAIAIWHGVNIAIERLPIGALALNRRAATALQIRDALLSGSIPKQRFAVYLRPFLTSGRLTRSRGLGLIEFETCLTDAFKIGWDWPLVSIGRPGDKFGSGRIPVDDDGWRRLVLLAITHAQAVLIVPGASEGTLWELKQLTRSDLREKTVVIMPPRSESLDVDAWWKRARDVAARHGYHLPKYDPKGRFLRVGDSGRVGRSTPIPDDWDVAYDVKRSLEPFVGWGIQ